MRLSALIQSVLVEKIEEINPPRFNRNVIQICVDPGVGEFLGFLKKAIYGELRGLYAKVEGQDDVLVLWDANEFDHNDMKKALRTVGFNAAGSPDLEFTLTPGYVSRDIARSKMVEIGKSGVYVTNNRKFRQSAFALRLSRYQANPDSASAQPIPTATAT